MQLKENIINKFKNKKVLLVLIPVILIVLGYGYKSKSEGDAVARRKAAEDEIARIKSEPHSSLNYYMTTAAGDDSMEATARLIAHTIETGCTKSYDCLREKFSNESLKWIQDFLVGSVCEEYKSPGIVCLDKGDLEYVYMLNIPKYGYKYEIFVGHANRYPSEFSLAMYELRLQ